MRRVDPRSRSFEGGLGRGRRIPIAWTDFPGRRLPAGPFRTWFASGSGKTGLDPIWIACAIEAGVGQSQTAVQHLPHHLETATSSSRSVRRSGALTRGPGNAG